MTAPLQQRLTYEDYCLLPEDGLRHEIIGGEHVAEPAPATYHQKLSRWLQHQLFEQIELTGRGQVFNAPTDLHLSKHDVVQPDLLVVLAEREGLVGEAKIEGPPDLVVEILSRCSRDRDLRLKRELYRSRGVPEYWIVDPEARVVEQLVLEPDGGYRLAGRFAERIAAATIAGVGVDLAKVW
ncbi:MAG TPA: Uma2 family endonuclease [Thermoanaerobaculia bacterium]|nr:Uma2 family endonuclease [Thermoanaerobaculia bacterium]